MRTQTETSLKHLWDFCQSKFGANATMRFARYIGDLIDAGEITKEDSVEFSKKYLAKTPEKKTGTRAKMVHEPFYDPCAGTMVVWDEKNKMYVPDPELDSVRRQRLVKEKRDKALKKALDKTPRYNVNPRYNSYTGCGSPTRGC